MRYVVKFPVKNDVILSECWPLRNKGRILHVEVKGGKLISVGEIFENVQSSDAPGWTGDNEGDVPTLNFPMSYIPFVEHDLRVWQSLISPYVFVDIDFDSPAEDFFPETEEERANVRVYSFSRSRSSGPEIIDEFAVVGNAFFAIDSHDKIIEQLSFYIEGKKAMRHNRVIDAYNYFYLYLESNLNLKYNNRDAALRLASSDTFVRTVDEFISFDLPLLKTIEGKLSGITKWGEDKFPLCDQIVKLRGHLRHHSLKNPNRWRLKYQDNYKDEAVFLGLVCTGTARPFFENSQSINFVQRFMGACEEVHAVIEVGITLSIQEAESLPREVGFKIKCPGLEPSPHMARIALGRALEELEKRSPGATLLGMKATVMPRGPELFRYDIGATIGRKNK